MKAIQHMALLLVGLVLLCFATPASASLTVGEAPSASTPLSGSTSRVAEPWRYPGLFACRCTLEEAVDLAVKQQLFTAEIGESILNAYNQHLVEGHARLLNDGEEFYSSFRHVNGLLGMNLVRVEFGPGWKDASRWVNEWRIPGTDIDLILPDACGNWSFKIVPGSAGGGHLPPVAQVVPPDTESGGPGIYWPSGPFDWFGPPGSFAGSPSDFGWPGFPGGGYPGGYIPPGGGHHHAWYHHHGHRGHHGKPPPPHVLPPTTIPEPSTFALLLVGLGGIAVTMRRKVS